MLLLSTTTKIKDHYRQLLTGKPFFLVDGTKVMVGDVRIKEGEGKYEVVVYFGIKSAFADNIPLEVFLDYINMTFDQRLLL